MIRRWAPRLIRDRRALAAVEFALLAPTMMLLLMGAYDLLYQSYAQAMLEGAVQKAGRDSSLQGGAQNTAAIDARVLAQVKVMAPGATYASSRVNYTSYAAMQPEYIFDTNSNGKLDKGECFTDVNGNNSWDADPSNTGQGGADDVTLYTMTITYPRLFPMAGLVGWSSNQVLKATTLLKNQPYASQTIISNKVCT